MAAKQPKESRARAGFNRPLSGGVRGGSCKDCKKVSFRDELGAKIALAKRISQDRGELRSYRCPVGRGWHLTSKRRGK